LGFEKSQRSVTHDSLRYINILTYLRNEAALAAHLAWHGQCNWRLAWASSSMCAALW